MSTRYLDSNQRVIGHAHDGTNLINIGSILNEHLTTQFVPPSGGVGSVMRAEFTFSQQDLYCIENLIMQFDIVNSSGTESPTFQNLLLLLSELKVLINNQEYINCKNSDEIYCKYVDTLKGHSEDEMWNVLNENRTELGKTFNGENVAVSSTKRFYINFTKSVCPELAQINTHPSRGTSKITIELRWTPNYNSAASNARFVLSNTTSNSYGSNLTFSDCKLLLDVKRYSDVSLYNAVTNPLMIRKSYEVKVIPCSFNGGTDKQLVNLSTDFSKHGLISGLYFYIFPTGLISAYNDSDALKIYSNFRHIGFEVKFKSKTIIKLDSASDELQRVRYYNTNYRNRFGNFPPSEIHSTTSALSQYYLPMVYIDLDNSQINRFEDEQTLSGVNNYESNFEFIFYSNVAISSSVNAYVALEYYDIVRIDAKTGSIIVR